VSLVDGLLVSGGTGALSDISNKGNFSCIILRSNEKQHLNSSKKCCGEMTSKDNFLTNSSYLKA
jgi:hypothetical protein